MRALPPCRDCAVVALSLAVLACGAHDEARDPALVLAAGSDAGSHAPEDAQASPAEAAPHDAAPSLPPLVGDGALGEPTCAHVHVAALRFRPRVWLLGAPAAMPTASGLDGDYQHTFADRLASTLLGPGGVLTSLDDQVRLGAILARGELSDDDACSELTVVQPATSNAAAVGAAFDAIRRWGESAGPAELQASTLSALAAECARDPAAGARDLVIWLVGPGTTRPGCDLGPTPIWLSSDEAAAAADAPMFAAMDAAAGCVDRVFVAEFGPYFVSSSAAGMPTYLLARDRSLAERGGTGAPISFLTDPRDLTPLAQGITAALAPYVSCSFSLEGAVSPGTECRGAVLIDGERVPCDAANGYRMRDAHTLELVGAACSALEAHPSAVLDVAFPCDAVVL